MKPLAARDKLSPVKSKFLLPAIFITVFAVSRIPGLMPPDFSVAYAFAFCAGVFFGGAAAWWLPLTAMLVTDVALNVFYYHTSPFGFYLVLNYAIYALLIALGKWFGRKAAFLKLLSGGLLGAVIFYLVTNTLSWLQDPAYAKTIAGWIQALTTALFTAAGKLTAESPTDKTAGAREPEAEGESEGSGEAKPEEAKA